MNTQTILSKTDHTLLAQDATWEQIKSVIDDAAAFGCASACIPPCFVKQAADYVGGKVKICTVVGFPNGYNTTQTKVFETQQAVRNGADEIDMVIHVGDVKAGQDDAVLTEINAVKQACSEKILKVIVETCALSEEEIKRMCAIVSRSGADYIKTSTGFGAGGATHRDIRLMKANCAPHIKIKAAGGIASLEDARQFLEEGADRLGTSRIVKIVKERNA